LTINRYISTIKHTREPVRLIEPVQLSKNANRILYKVYKAASNAWPTVKEAYNKELVV
jgi:hypothetical protein